MVRTPKTLQRCLDAVGEPWTLLGYYMSEVILRRVAHLSLPLILLIYVVAGVCYALTAPLLDVSDEVRHYAMVEHLARGSGLPVQDPALNQAITDEERRALRPLTYYAQEGSQPPLYYALMALVALPVDRSDYADRVWPNPHARLGRADATNNWNQLVHRPDESFPWRGTAWVTMLMRFIGIALGAVTVAATFGLAHELRLAAQTRHGPVPAILDSPLVAPLAAALVAFNPMFGHIMASVNNDTLATALSTLALLLGARMIRCNAETRTAIVLGIVLGCAALTKASGLALVIVVPGCVLMSGVLRASWREHASPSEADKSADETVPIRFAKLRRHFLAIALPAATIAGWWYARNHALYGEFTGTTMMARIAGPREFLPSASELIGEWDGFFKAYWGLFGAVNIPMHELIYAALEAMMILAGVGLALIVRDQWRALRGQGVIAVVCHPAFLISAMLLGAFLIAFVALIRWTSLTLASQGRLLFPVIAPIAIFTALGVLRLADTISPARRRAAQWTALPAALTLAIPVGLAMLTLLAPFVYIRPAYAWPQRLPASASVPLGRQTELLFEDKIRYLGFRVNTPRQRVQPGDLLDVTLYWQALRPLDTNYSVFIKVLAKGEVPVHELDTYPGGGMWPTTLWQPGEIVADRYRLRITDVPTNVQLAPSTLWLDVGVWNFTTQQFLKTYEPGGAETGRQRYEAASLNVARPAPNFQMKSRFEQAALIGVRVERTVQGLLLSLDWLATQDFTDDYTTFVQLFDAQGNKMDPQDDRRAKDGNFAPRWWRAGDLILNDTYTLTLPADFPAGPYVLKFGLYNRDGQRMPAYDDAGRLIPDAALSLPVTIE